MICQDILIILYDKIPDVVNVFLCRFNFCMSQYGLRYSVLPSPGAVGTAALRDNWRLPSGFACRLHKA